MQRDSETGGITRTIKNVEALWRRHHLTDTDIQCGGRMFEAHSNVLAAHSPRLRDALLTQKKRDRFCLNMDNECSPEIFDIILEYFYTYELPITDQNVGGILLGATVLEVNSLRSACASFVEKGVTNDNALIRLRIAERYNLEKLRQQALGRVVTNFHQLSNNEDIFELTFDTLHTILSAEDLGIFETEFEIVEHISAQYRAREHCIINPASCPEKLGLGPPGGICLPTTQQEADQAIADLQTKVKTILETCVKFPAISHTHLVLLAATGSHNICAGQLSVSSNGASRANSPSGTASSSAACLGQNDTECSRVAALHPYVRYFCREPALKALLVRKTIGDEEASKQYGRKKPTNHGSQA